MESTNIYSAVNNETIDQAIQSLKQELLSEMDKKIDNVKQELLGVLELQKQWMMSFLHTERSNAKGKTIFLFRNQSQSILLQFLRRRFTPSNYNHLFIRCVDNFKSG